MYLFRPGLVLVTSWMACASSLLAQGHPTWTEPIAPFRMIGNVYYVGTRGLASYLITTPEGHILINSNTEETSPLIQASIEKLGFRLPDVKMLLISHAHWDHCGGSARMKRLTGAKYLVMAGDVAAVESGGAKDFHYGNSKSSHFKPSKVDRVLHDGDKVEWGGTILIAHLTPGHTQGCTTWTMAVREGAKTYQVVIVGSPNVNPGYKLVANSRYSQISEDYEKCFRVLKALPCDVFLGAHGDYFQLSEKIVRRKEGNPNPFIDPAGYQTYVAERERAFRAELQKQKSEKR